MWKNPILVLVAFVIAPHLGYGQESKTALDGVSKAMGESSHYNIPAAARSSRLARASPPASRGRVLA